jgi:hypothetical protein
MLIEGTSSPRVISDCFTLNDKLNQKIIVENAWLVIQKREITVLA